MNKIIKFSELNEEIDFEEDFEDTLPEEYYLLKFNDDYADEFDVNGICLMTGDEWRKYQEEFTNYTRRITFYFGTNEEIEYRNGRDLLRNVRASKINKTEYDIIKRLIMRGGNEYGIFPELDLIH